MLNTTEYINPSRNFTSLKMIFVNTAPNAVKEDTKHNVVNNGEE